MHIQIIVFIYILIYYVIYIYYDHSKRKLEVAESLCCSTSSSLLCWRALQLRERAVLLLLSLHHKAPKQQTVFMNLLSLMLERVILVAFISQSCLATEKIPLIEKLPFSLTNVYMHSAETCNCPELAACTSIKLCIFMVLFYKFQ